MASRRTGRPEAAFTVDRASGRIIAAGPEEVDATQPLLDILIDEAGWDVSQIATRPQWRVPASPSASRDWPVDIALFDDASTVRDPDHVRIICECKRPDVETGIGQLKIYLDREPHARVGVWFNGTVHAVVYKTATGYEVAPAGTPIPTPRDPLVPTGTKVLTLNDLRVAPSLAPAFRRIRDRLATADTNVNRDEEILPDLSLMLLLKILDEQGHQFTPARPLDFQLDESEARTAKRIKDFLANEVRRNTDLFGVTKASEVRLQIDDHSIAYIVETLQNLRLLSNDGEAVSKAFQVLRGKAYKGEEGQFFTPPPVVAVAIAAVDPRPQDRVIDPACGSGSFLAAALSNVVGHLEAAYGSDGAAKDLARREWSTRHLFALDKDAVSVRLSKAYLSMLGDGSTHVYKIDSIRHDVWSSALAATVQDSAFDVVVTNPPFGTKLKVPAAVGRREGFAVCQKWKRDPSGAWAATGEFVDREIGIVFLERCIRLLADGGRLAIVLPDTYLFSESYQWLVQWLGQFTITHSINVPIEAFEPFCRAKTSVLVLEKRRPEPAHRVVGAVCETYGADKHGRSRFVFASGVQTAEIDNEMRQTANLIATGAITEDRLRFTFPQAGAVAAGVLVASHWWRAPYMDAAQTFAGAYGCDLRTIGDLIDSGELVVTDGHGSPSSHFHGRGDVPYIKVVDIKNWRVVENPSYFIPDAEARRLRRSKVLREWDLLTPTRASKNIGLFGVVMPWQTGVVLTREIGVWRVPLSARLLTPWLLLALMSLRVVHDQFAFAVLMQTNREDLGKRYRDIVLPIPRDPVVRDTWAGPVETFLRAQATARGTYDALSATLSPDLFADRP